MKSITGWLRQRAIDIHGARKELAFFIAMMLVIWLLKPRPLTGNADGFDFEYWRSAGSPRNEYHALLLEDPCGKRLEIFSNRKEERVGNHSKDYYTITSEDGKSVTYGKATVTMSYGWYGSIMGMEDAMGEATETLDKWVPIAKKTGKRNLFSR
jgi:hypothetical protein